MSSFAEHPLLFDEAPAQKGAPSYLADHRSRLRARFAEGGADAMPDYELLELLLFRIVPRRDVKPLARALIDRFADVGGVLAASADNLAKTPGIGPAVASELKVTEAVVRRCLRTRALNRPIVSSWQALIDYCHATMSRETTERFRILFLDTKNTLIADEEQARGTVDHVPVYPREVVKRALELDAKALILVHNHPSGDPTPSDADISMTWQIAEACTVLGLTLHDHIIIGHGTETSFRGQGYL
ncbi:hypothetical protein PARPLA_00090 [Rhodobacteraceae bacterium THAF1]|uniref:RadC family protein n=1 Tax=Palleronia sp. THAF1 TaxID=2587842 RepID=UPI000F3D4CFD|nr:DNA repair protein RadC [Palleronia sp. THAF1]QFU07097.1 hypothetical protein FIU81_00185 [Palleronia sp. THAF1]VDC16750.1 hypothetical protein PARPLA_00090 [Rhodobacteraceae bacterium THAF1]